MFQPYDMFFETLIIFNKSASNNFDSRALFLAHRGSAIRGFTENEGRKSDAKVHQIFESEKKISPGVEIEGLSPKAATETY